MKIYSFSIFLIFISILVSFPFITEAFENIQEILWYLVDFFNDLTRIAAAAALLFFFWGLAKFILNADNEKARADGKRLMQWGITALFVMVSIWGIITFFQEDIF
ncbi:MAG: hypothetical protein KAR00_02980 [Candidatus Pacebacteria bacterium]|nr:hypothetical protein [Candidatus Paceibacterota bacterium]